MKSFWTVYSIRIICLWQNQVVVYKPCTQCHFGILVNWQTKFKKLWLCLPQHEKQNWHDWLLYSCLIEFCFEFLMLSFIVHFHKKWKTKYTSVCSYIYIYIYIFWLNGWVFFYRLSGSGFEYSCRNTARFLFFIFMKVLKNELLKQIKINFMFILTSMVYILQIFQKQVRAKFLVQCFPKVGPKVIHELFKSRKSWFKV